MKKMLLLPAVILFSGVLYAQKTTLEKVVDSSCKCLNDAKGKIRNSADFNKIGQGCIMNAAAPYLEEIAKDEGISFDGIDSDSGEKLGQKIGIKLATSCPAFLELYTQYGHEDEETEIKGTVSGMITFVDQTTANLTLTIKDDAGKLTRLTWLTYFEGADDYKANPLLLKGKKAEINWTQVELYSVKQKDFIVVKEVTALSVK